VKQGTTIYLAFGAGIHRRATPDASIPRHVTESPPEFAEALSGPDHSPLVLDRWRPWLALAAVLVAIAYGPTLLRLATTTPLTTPGFRGW
jgi:hypothetical protein